MSMLRSIRGTQKTWAVVLAGALLAWWAGASIATEDGAPLVLGLGGCCLLFPVVHAIVVRRLSYGLLTVEVPVLLLLLSTLVLRGRSADELAYNPLDPAAQFRVVCIALALLLGMIAFASTPAQRISGPPQPSLPFRLYGLYALIVFVGAPFSVSPYLTVYRGVELVAGLLVLAGAVRSVGSEAVARILRVLYWFGVALLGTVWLGVVVAPDRAITRIHVGDAPIPWQIQGVYPSVASNGVGTLAAIIAVWSLANATRQRDAGSSTWLAYTVATVAFVTLVASQYRTGYIGVALSMVVLLILRKNFSLAGMLVVAAATIVFFVPSIAGESQSFALRGQTVEQAQDLSGRVTFWSLAIPVWERSPVIGRGLLTGTRFEVLAPAGFTLTAGIHSTWVEALVGTGLMGVTVLGLSFLIVVRRTLRAALTGDTLAPLLVLIVLGVRSVTGNTFESASYEGFVFLALALAVADRPARLRRVASRRHVALGA